MKKIFVFFLIFLVFLFGNAFVMSKKSIETKEITEIRGVYISYLEYLTYFKDNSLSINKAYINKMLDNISSFGFNAIFLQVSPFSDSIYNSKIFPFSYTLSGVEGKNPGMDYLEYFIKESNKRNLQVHAWINPYRISSTSDVSKISKTNPAYSLLNTNDVRVSDLGIYYNPASPKTIDLILKQVYELISNYNLAGIHFDDYFYVDQEIDKKNYEEYFKKNDTITLSDYRLQMINTTIKNVYQLIKSYDKNILFSISPDGNIDNNYRMHFADVKTWLTEPGYIDMIMPQVYYGFENEYKPYIETINEWNNMIKNGVKLVPVLAFYKVGNVDSQAGTGKMEWVSNDSIIKREINYARSLSKYDGFALFRYDFLFNETLKTENTNQEIENMKTILSKN